MGFEASRLGEPVAVLDELQELPKISSATTGLVPVVQRSESELRALKTPTTNDPYEPNTPRVILQMQTESASNQTLIDLLLNFADGKAPSSIYVPDGDNQEALIASYRDAFEIRKTRDRLTENAEPEPSPDEPAVLNPDAAANEYEPIEIEEDSALTTDDFGEVRLPSDRKAARESLTKLLKSHSDPGSVIIEWPNEGWVEKAKLWWAAQTPEAAEQWVFEQSQEGRFVHEVDEMKVPEGAAQDLLRELAQGSWAIQLPDSRSDAKPILDQIVAENGDPSRLVWPEAGWVEKGQEWIEKKLSSVEG